MRGGALVTIAGIMDVQKFVANLEFPTLPQALHYKKYSPASDMWSFGVVMYEIWSLGHQPFENYSNAKAMEQIDKGMRLPPPPGCPKAVYSLMIQCW